MIKKQTNNGHYVSKKELRAILKKHNLTRPEVADLLNVSLSTIDNWLYRKTKIHRNYIDLLNLKLN